MVSLAGSMGVRRVGEFRREQFGLNAVSRWPLRTSASRERRPAHFRGGCKASPRLWEIIRHKQRRGQSEAHR